MHAFAAIDCEASHSSETVFVPQTPIITDITSLAADERSPGKARVPHPTRHANRAERELLDRVLEAASIGESTDWEFKSARGGFPGSFWETYSAFANSEGGTVVLGAREDDGTVRLDGLAPTQLASYKKILWDGLNNRSIVSRNLLSDSDVRIVTSDRTHLLVIRVPRATRDTRPVHLGPMPLGHTFRRQHEGDYRCGDFEVRRMLRDADPEPCDLRIPEGFGLDAIDMATFEQYRQLFRNVRGDHAWADLNPQDFLERLGGWRSDTEAGIEGPTLAGILMFGTDRAIRDPRALPAYFMDYREKLDADIRWSDRVYPDCNWEPNLFQFYRRVWPKISAGLPLPFQLVDGVRIDKTPAHDALREAFINALIHTDYTAPGGVVLERYPDRFVIENPGVLLVSLEQLRRGGVSDCRNRTVQKMFLLIGGGEQAGSGVDKIRAGWRSRHWRAPLLETQTHPDRVLLTLPMLSLIPERTLARLRGLFGAGVDALTPAELQAVATAEIEGTVSNARLQELLIEHRSDITRILTALRDRGYLVSDNRRRWARYELASECQNVAGDSSGLTGDSSDLAADSDELRAIAAPIAGKGKASAAAVRTAITQLCEGRFLTTESLGHLLNRNTENLRNSYLTPMVRNGILRLRYAEVPNHPNQAYTTAGA